MNTLGRIAAAAALAISGVVHAGHHGKAGKNIVETAASAGQFETLIAAASAAGLADALAGPGPLTVFAPTDEAFAKLPAGTVESLLEPENIDQLAAILKYHVVAGRLQAKDVLARDTVETLDGGKPAISTRDGEVFIDNAKIVTVDVAASNGVIHVIDTVLIPPAQTAAQQATDLIELAIARGVPLYNNGDARACAAVYEVAARALLAMDLDAGARARLERGLDRMSHGSWSDRAWTLRRTLDATYASVSGSHDRMMSLAIN